MSTSNADAGSVSALLLLLIVDFCKEKQISIPEECKFFFDEKFSELNNFYSRVPFKIWKKIIYNIQDQYPIEGLGLCIAQHINISYAGVLSYLVFCKPNLFEALGDFIKYERLVFDFNVVSVRIKESMVELSWSDYYGKAGQLIDEMIFSIFFQVVNYAISPQKIKIDSISFYYPEPTNRAIYENFFGCPVYFNTEKITVLVSVKELKSKSLSSSDPILYNILKLEADTLLSNLPSNYDFEQRLETSIICCMKLICLETVSEYIGINKNILKKKLAEKNINFNIIVNNIRKKLALEYLKNNDLSISEISYLLGYSEQSAFQRAFKNWMGTSPLQYRKNILI
ncbi:AraC family transcriptional regulator [Acinetobacter seifertii]|uniref:AraC family transcriptional regulator n=1 Tax=Acinetobacter seifertii TaxID=1530123 RepID=UPI0032B3D5EE